MATCDSEMEALWRDATFLLGEAFKLLTKFDQSSDPAPSDIESWFKRLIAFEDECDRRNVFTLIR